MPITASLQEKKRNLAGMREAQAGRFEKARSAPEHEKIGVLEEIKRVEPDLLKLHNEVVAEEEIVVAELKNEEELKSLREGMKPDRVNPFSVRDAARSPLGTQVDMDALQSLGEMIAGSEAVKTYLANEGGNKQRGMAMEFGNFKSLKEGLWNNRALEQIQGAMANASPEEIKAILTTSGLTGYDRQPGIVLQGVQQPHVSALIPQGETTAPTIRYVREVSFTPAATSVLEGGLKPDAAWEKMEVDAPVRKIAVRTTVTEEMMEDFPAFRDYLMMRLPFMVEIEEDDQLLNGDGTGANLRGVYNTSGILLHQQGYDVDETTAITGDTAIDALLRAATRVQAESFFEPTGIVLNPFKWMNMRLTRTGTGDDVGGANRGMYLLGNPNDPEQASLWGYPVVKTTRTAVNTGAVGAWNLACQIFRRKGITTDMTNTDGDDWKYNRVSIRSEERLAFPIYRPQALAKVTFVGSR